MITLVTTLIIAKEASKSNRTDCFFVRDNISDNFAMTQRHIPTELKKRNDELNNLTVESVSQAFMFLMKTKAYEKITITDICKKAGVSRNAFYKNFKTKENVFKRIVLEFNKEIFRKFGSPFRKRVGVEWYINFFRIVKEYESLFLLIIKANFRSMFLDYVNSLLTLDQESSTQKLTRLMWNGAIQNITVEWIRNGMLETAEEMATLCYEKLSPMM